MKFLQCSRSILFLFNGISFFCFLWLYSDEFASDLQQNTVTYRSCAIKVLLHEFGLKQDTSLHIKSAQGVILIDPEDSKKTIKYSKNDLYITIRDGSLFLNGHKSKKKQIIIKPIEGNLFFDSAEYQGEFIVFLDNDNGYLINKLHLEDYVYAVLRTESWPGWPLEVNKVFAVACRTYALGLLLKAKKTEAPFHIRNSNKHQTYKGFHMNALLLDAVKQTERMFITHNNRPILAMFDTCCGGVIPAHMTGVDFKNNPYLARDYPCNYCKNMKKYRWSVECDLKELERLFSSEINGLSRLRDVRVSKKDKAGIARHVTLKCARNSHELAGKQLYSLIKDVKSFCFDIKRNGNTIVISGKGYGHHMGLCQWGARAMVDEGWGFKEIIHFYYPGTRLSRLV